VRLGPRRASYLCAATALCRYCSVNDWRTRHSLSGYSWRSRCQPPSKLFTHLGPALLRLLARLVGILLFAIAVELALSGLRTFFHWG
jgi:hypothetical protein